METLITASECMRRAPCGILRAFIAGALCAGAMYFRSAAPVGAQTNVDIIDTWTDAGIAGWTNSALPQCVLSNPGGYLNLKFTAQSQSDFVSDIMQRDSTGIVVTNISFRFLASNTPPSAVRVYFHSAVRGNSWYVNLDPPVAGGWVTYDVPLNTTKAWSMGPDGSVDQFNSDIEWVDWVGVYVRRHGDPSAQNYCVDDFRIQGFQLLDTDGDGMPDTWEIANYLDPDDSDDSLLDYDGDGISNLNEYRTGTDPWDVRDSFTARIEGTDPDTSITGVVVKWRSARNRTYKIYRAMDLMQGFSIYASGIPGNPPVNSFVDVTATNAGPYFYKIVME